MPGKRIHIVLCNNRCLASHLHSTHKNLGSFKSRAWRDISRTASYTYRKLKFTKPETDAEFLLRFTINEMNDTIGPNGLVPSALVFGKYPSTRIFDDPIQERPNLSSRSELSLLAQPKMSRIIAKLRVNRGLRHTLSPSVDTYFEPGDQFSVWREKQISIRIGDCMEPFTVQYFDPVKKLVRIW